MEDSVASGTRVRVWLTPQSRELEGAAVQQHFRGTLMAHSSDSLTLSVHPESAPVRLAWAGVDRLERSRGVPSRLQSALGTGFQWAAFGALEFVLLDRLSDDPVFSSAGQAILAGGVAGASLGIVLGSVSPRERWTRVQLR